jgi:hypothetical protein
MISLSEYVGPHSQSPDWTMAIQANAHKLLTACAALEVDMVAAGVVFPDNPATKSGVSGQTYGGFRPQNCPQGAEHSAHKEGLAVDRYDPHGDIDTYLMKRQDLLVKYGIFIEHPSKTDGWSHWSAKPPGSGNHVFYP